MRAFAFLSVYLVPLSAALGVALGGSWLVLTPLLVFGLVPALDLLAGPDPWNPTEEKEPRLSSRMTFRVVAWLCVPVQLALLAWALHRVASANLSAWEVAGAAIAVGISTGAVGITVAHELIHRTSRWERGMGLILLGCVCYLHWAIEHVHGHHRNVATPLDPATARYGESLYRFLPRTLWGSLVSAWRIGAARGAKAGGPWAAHRNPVPAQLSLEAVTLAAVYFGLGTRALLFFVGQAAVAVLLLEVVNYLEHYGLERRMTEDGRYERVGPRHSWNSCDRITNYLLLHLQRHTDHHMRPQRRFQVLRHLPESPQLPTGYAGMVLLAVVPPLWRKVMDPRAASCRG